MSGEEFYLLFATHHGLRRQLICAVQRFPKYQQIGTDLLQTAWIAIAESHAGMADTYYFYVGTDSAERVFRTRYWRLTSARRQIEEKRVFRRRRFFLKLRKNIL